MQMVHEVSVIPYPSRTLAPKHTLKNIMTSLLIGEAPVVMSLTIPPTLSASE